MPTQKPRLPLTIDDDLMEIITDLARLSKTPKTKIVTDILVGAKPALEDLRNALLAVEQKQNALPHLAKISAYVNTETANLNGEMLSLVELVAKGGKSD